MPAKRIKLEAAPYRDGSLLHFPYDWGSPSSIQWLKNDPFHATLRIADMRSGRSAKYVIWEPVGTATDTRTFPMFIADLVDLLQSAEKIEHGIVSARWQVRKRGQNYGICLAPED